MDFDDPGLANRYAMARRISPQAMRVWTDAISANVDPGDIRVILDIGGGTGRFATALSDVFDADVICVDRSRTMLAEAQRIIRSGRVQLVCGRAEQLPAGEGSFGLAFMSMVYHHLANPNDALRECRRVLRGGGYLCIRNSTVELLDRVDYLKFFPSALADNRTRLPSQRDVIATAIRSGFSLIKHEVIEHEFAASLSEYLDKIGRRALSDLVVLPDQEFHSGLRAMEEALRDRVESGPIVKPIELFIFERSIGP